MTDTYICNNLKMVRFLFIFYAEGDEVQNDYNGCPPEIFSLTSLERLNLSYQGLFHLTPKIQMLENLKELVLNNNPLLESLPGALSKLQHLHGLYLYQAALFLNYNIYMIYIVPICNNIVLWWKNNSLL